MPVALLKARPSGLEKSWSAVSDEMLTSALSAPASAPNRYTSQVKAETEAPSFMRTRWPLGLPVCAEVPFMSVQARGLAASGRYWLPVGFTLRLLLLVSVKQISPLAGFTAFHSGRAILVAPTAAAARRVLMAMSAASANLYAVYPLTAVLA